MASKIFTVTVFAFCSSTITGLFFRRNSYINISKLEIFSHPGFVDVNSTIIHLDNQSHMDAYFNVLLDIEFAFLEIHVKHHSKGSYLPSFLNFNINGCDFLKMKNTFPILEQIYYHFRQYGKLVDRCPIKKDVYYGKNMEIPTFIFPAVLPSSKYVMELFYRQKPAQSPILKISIYFEFKKLSKAN